MNDVKLCPRDDEPLVSTFEFPRYELYCVVCGWKGGIFDGSRGESTPERAARHGELTERYKAERAEREGRQYAPAPAWTGPQPSCVGCGREPDQAESVRNEDGKPLLWYGRRDRETGEWKFACSQACIEKAEPRQPIMPW